MSQQQKNQKSNLLNDNIFINIDEVMKRDFLFNMIYGARGFGKTYGSLFYAYKEYKKTGYGAIYLRRFKTELKDFNKQLNTLIADGKIDKNKVEFDKSGKKFIDSENGKVILQAMPLTQAITKKSTDFSDISLIIFDEFIIDKGAYHYIPEEFANFNNMYESVARLRELTEGVVVKVLMLANCASRNNPYFIGYNIPVFKGNEYKNNDLLVLSPDTSKFKEVKMKTRWAQFVKNHTDMEKYMLDGEFNDKTDFICKSLPSKTKYIATLKYVNEYIGVYKDNENDLIFLSNKINNNTKYIYSLTKADNTPDILLLKNNKKLFDVIKMYYDLGALRFTDLKIQTIFVDILKIL